MIRAVLLDWHGVLDRRRLAGIFSFFPPGTEERFRKEIEDYTIGKMEPEEFWAIIPNREAARDHILSIEKNERVWRLIPEWKLQYRLGIISDCPKDKKAEILKWVDLSAFDPLIFSCDHGKLKKDLLKLALEKLGCQPGECIFLDDSRENVEEARKIGMEAVAYHDKLDMRLVL